ncbi:hypothetical protein NLG97_g5688 [Lecanicillium saksenae]|uniref:Uncharacterized protein n=1 Tax=Lecanicillium saksenae TaxID=468837 RepID=A0ACC1QTM4_9HYPO|nr:hypothetical protein NLG97_g5688 [Lecanicillium saksenae]
MPVILFDKQAGTEPRSRPPLFTVSPEIETIKHRCIDVNYFNTTILALRHAALSFMSPPCKSRSRVLAAATASKSPMAHSVSETTVGRKLCATRLPMTGLTSSSAPHLLVDVGIDIEMCLFQCNLTGYDQNTVLLISANMPLISHAPASSPALYNHTSFSSRTASLSRRHRPPSMLNIEILPLSHHSHRLKSKFSEPHVRFFKKSHGPTFNGATRFQRTDPTHPDLFCMQPSRPTARDDIAPAISPDADFARYGGTTAASWATKPAFVPVFVAPC